MDETETVLDGYEKDNNKCMKKVYRVKCEYCTSIVDRAISVKRAICYRCRMQKEWIARELRKSQDKAEKHKIIDHSKE